MMMIKPFLKVHRRIGLVDVGWSKLYLCSWKIYSLCRIFLGLGRTIAIKWGSNVTLVTCIDASPSQLSTIIPDLIILFQLRPKCVSPSEKNGSFPGNSLILLTEKTS